MSPKSQTHIQGLDGLRGIAIILIFLVHAWGHAGGPNHVIPGSNLGVIEIRSYLYSGGRAGLEMIFIISGFLLSLPFWRHLLTTSENTFPIRIKDFISHRFIRIYPVYFLAVILYALFHDTDHPLVIRAIHLVTHFLLVHNFFEATISNLSEPLWFVATIFQLYILLPFVLLCIWHLAKKGFSILKVVVFIFIIGGLTGILFFQASLFLLSHINLDPRIVSINGKVLVRSPFSFLASFSVGILCSYLYACFESKKNKKSLIYTLITGGGIIGSLFILLAAAIAEYSLIGFPPSYWPGVQLLLGALLLLITLSSHKFVITQLLEFYPIRFFGMISYSFYLYHDFILWNIHNRLSPLLGNSPFNTNISKSILAFVLTTWVAWIFYEFVEKRLTRFSNIWIKVRS